MSEVTDQEKDFALPPNVLTKNDISRLIIDLERVDNDFTAAAAREKAGVESAGEPALSEQLADFLSANQLEITSSLQRSQILDRLRQLKNTVPTIHMTFASAIDQESLQELVVWLRQSVHAQSVVSVGLQPSLIGGVYLRTSNHVLDLSMRAQLAGHRDLIVKEVEALSGSK